jgi:hypothetical protein
MCIGKNGDGIQLFLQLEIDHIGELMIKQKMLKITNQTNDPMMIYALLYFSNICKSFAC